MNKKIRISTVPQHDTRLIVMPNERLTGNPPSFISEIITHEQEYEVLNFFEIKKEEVQTGMLWFELALGNENTPHFSDIVNKYPKSSIFYFFLCIPKKKQHEYRKATQRVRAISFENRK